MKMELMILKKNISLSLASTASEVVIDMVIFAV